MKLLLDAHVFIWWTSDPSQLSPTALAAFCDPANEMLVSIVSIWEIQIKMALGKLTMGQPLRETLDQEQSISLLELKLEHVLGLESLPPLHGDPFDRMLISQAQVEGATLVTRDRIFANYAVPILW
jgi:PIN domain nuclease of toxin-antitoxin system